MNYKQKYEEAIERCKSWIRGEHPECFTEAQKTGEFIFPELRESEDERIRKALIRFFSKSAEYDSSTNGIKDRNIIAWLKKQGEQKPTWSEEDESNLNGILDCYKSMDIKWRNWLKSIKPQQNQYDKGYNDGYSAAKYNHWKPSEEQLRALINSAQGLYQCKEKEVLLDLYEQLKNL